MKAVFAADDPIQAYAVKNFLEAEGIPAVVVGEGMFPLRGTGASFSADSLPQVYVTNDEDAPRAMELLRAHRPSTGSGRGEPVAPRAPVEEPSPHLGRPWVRWFLLFVLCSIAASILVGLWSLLSVWLRRAPW
jgi:hypothetical protein